MSARRTPPEVVITSGGVSVTGERSQMGLFSLWEVFFGVEQIIQVQSYHAVDVLL